MAALSARVFSQSAPVCLLRRQLGNNGVETCSLNVVSSPTAFLKHPVRKNVLSKRGSVRCEAQGSEKAKKELEEIANKVSEKADEISKDFSKSTENIKQAALSQPPVPPAVETAGLGPEKIPSGPYSFREVFKFDGLAPEITNGRIAMLSYLSVITLEYFKGKGIVEQLSTGGWIPALVITTLIGVASVVPLFRGYRNDDWPGIGPFTAKAERWNSRAAMVAFALLLTVELVKGGPEIVQGGPIGF